MSTEFESFVRPFQSNDITPSQVYYTPGQLSQPNVILRIGRGGSGKVLTGSYSYDETFYVTSYVTEQIHQFRLATGYYEFRGQFGQGNIGTPGT